jgi:hypothetical protein
MRIADCGLRISLAGCQPQSTIESAIRIPRAAIRREPLDQAVRAFCVLGAENLISFCDLP